MGSRDRKVKEEDRSGYETRLKSGFDMMAGDVLVVIISFIPAMIANSLAVVFGGGAPIDGGKRWRGKRIFGDGKTWRGLLGGGLSAALIGIVLHFIFNPFISIYPSLPGGLIAILSLSFGSLFGDIGGSFVKRRLGKARGSKSPIIDRYDFVVGAFLLTYIISHDWFAYSYLAFPGILGTFIIILILPVLHRGVNIIGYKLGLKKEPW